MTVEQSHTGKIGHIKNPLTVISRFAAIAELSGTAVLPFLTPENQSTYILFLMAFPIYLVGIFFLTLNFNHKTLYAPSDYENQDDFLKLFGIVTPQERDEKLSAEAKETDLSVEPSHNSTSSSPASNAPTEAEPVEDVPVENASLTEVDHVEPASSNSNSEEQGSSPEARNSQAGTIFDLEGFTKRSHIESMAKLEFIEKRSLEKLKLATSIDFSPKIKFQFPGFSKPILFDAIAQHGDTIHIAEVKYFDQKFSQSRFLSTITNARIASQNLNEVSKVKVQLHLVVILSTSTPLDIQHNIESALRNAARNFDVPCKVYIATLDDLASPLTPLAWITNQNTPKG